MLSKNEVTEGLLIAVLGANFVCAVFYRLAYCDSLPIVGPAMTKMLGSAAL